MDTVAKSNVARWADPWFWVLSGVMGTALAALLALANVVSVVVACCAVAGLLAVGIGVAIRLTSSEPPRSRQRPWLGLVLAGFQALLALGFTWTLLAALIGVDPLAPGSTTFDNPPPLRPGLGLILWLLVVPLSAVGALTTWRHQARQAEWTVPFETAGVLMFAAGAILLAGFALTEAFTLRFFLSVLAALVSVAVPFMVVPVAWQRGVFSGAVVFHFAAILNATLAAPPAPWILAQTWTRLARPYLEFMYLNNAYHFYSPDPGPASYLWFRLYYDTGEKLPDSDEPKLDGVWFKIPNINDKGEPQYHVPLEYQRYLSLTENVIPSEGTPPLYFRTPDGKANPAPFFESRIINSPDGNSLQQEIVGRPKPRFVLSVPFHQFITNDQQYQKPNLATIRLLESYVRHVAKIPHPVRERWPLHSVRVYRATHMIPPWNVYAAGMEPTDPEFYRPYYLGRYDPEGKLMDVEEPLLYWMLPILRDNSSAPLSPIRNWAARHAGDPQWVYDPRTKEWTAPKE